ncbi:T9SS type A sorting domain-containing protein [Winogradskyella rapida]|uniref:T9SS type A sorting domain-containing protein n=1 Tax=Winogradskyella rapida TaxID=549701 RepID=A0ABW3KTR7_9FLAO
MKKQVLLSLALIFSIATLSLKAQNWNEIIKATASDGAATDNFGFRVAIDGDYAIVGARGNDDAGSDSGSAYILVRSGNSWVEQTKLTASDGASGDAFGRSVAIAGDYAIVGAPFDDDGASASGSAYIFKRSGNSWTEQAKLTASDGAVSDYFGYSVAIDGDYAIIGASYDDDGASASGSAYIFNRSGNSWTEQTKLTASDAAATDYFGYSVAIDGDYAIVGAYNNAHAGYRSGSAYIFVRSGNSWAEQAKLTASDGVTSDYFGCSVAIAGDSAIVGAYLDDDAGSSSGSAYIFMRSGNIWTEQAKLTASDADGADQFGYSVAITGDSAIVGAYGNNDAGSSSGSAYIFKRLGNSWTEQSKLTASDADVFDYFGWSVAIAGDSAIIGALRNSDAGTDSGSAYFFELETPEPPADINWNEIINTTASDGVANDEFGFSVAIDGDYAIVGARFNDDAGPASGSAYIFTRSGNSWTEQTKLTASDGAALDFFGWSVAIAGDYAIVGAYQNDDAGSSSGSAYIFTRSGNSWTEQVKLTASDAAAEDLFGQSVAIAGDYAIVGAYENDDAGGESGSAYIFIRSGNSWIEQTKLTASDGATYDEFGYSVAIAGDYAIVGARGNDDAGSSSGSAYIFMRSGNSWAEQSKLTASDGAALDFFGWSVAIAGDYAIVGAYRDTDIYYYSGSAYIFKRSGNSWTEQVKLTASDAAGDDLFGSSVAIASDYAIVGAYGNDDAGSSSGSAYIFKRSGNSWTEQTKLSASDGAASDVFGISVAIDGDSAIVGASGNDDEGSRSGSAYFFEREIVLTYTYNNGWLSSNPDGVATASDVIIIAEGNATINSNTSANTVTVNPGAGLLLDTGVTLSVTNGVSLASNATSYSSVVGAGAIAGDIQYHRFVNSNLLGNDLISAPLSGQTWENFLDAANASALLSNPGNPTAYAFAPFDKTTGAYENFDANSIADLTSGVGYRAATNNGETLTFTGTIPETVTVDITDSGPDYAKWNLVGNPYPSYINVQAFLSHEVGVGVSNLDLLLDETAAIYGYNGNASGSWTIYNLSNTTASTVIAPGQGFYVAAEASQVPNYNLEFTKAMQTTGSADDFIAGRTETLQYLKLGLNSNSNNAHTEFYFNANATLGLDKGYDATLWGTAAPAFSLYSHLVEDNVGKPIALQSLNSMDLAELSIPLGVNANQGEQITFKIEDTTLPLSANIYLDDVVANTSTLLTESDYIITPSANLLGTGRFFLRISEDALSSDDRNFEAINMYYSKPNKSLIVAGQLQENTYIDIYDMQGRKVLSSALKASLLENHIPLTACNAGVYVVNLKNKTEQKSQKIIIN